MVSVGLPILTYHSIDESGSVISIAPSLFRQQMAFLAAHGFRTLTLSEAVRYLAAGQPGPPNAVVLTFDDAYRNVYTEAFPVLAEYGFKATIFVITDCCGTTLNWPGLAGAAGPLPVMDWPAITEMHDYGIAFGAHTHTHPDLTRIPPDEAEHEIVTSKTILQDRLGAPVDTFAYPFGYFNDQVRSVAQRHFTGAVSTKLGHAGPSADLHALRRLDVYFLQSQRVFQSLSSGRLELYLRTRQLLRNARHALGNRHGAPLPTLLPSTHTR